MTLAPPPATASQIQGARHPPCPATSDAPSAGPQEPGAYAWTGGGESSISCCAALHALGFEWESFEYFAFVLEAVSGAARDDEWALQIMYGIGGETDLTEHTLDHLSGYRNSRPVRIGNGAYDQQQHDVWGMLLDSLAIHSRRDGVIAPAIWEAVAGLVDQAIERNPEPDQGIWEMRGDPKHFVASKVMCWVAADRGSRLARNRDDEQRADRWRAAADSIKAEVLEKGVDERGVFVGLSNDAEGTFTICSFWLVSALAMIGEIGRARALFEKLLSFAGPLHLYAEEIDVTTGQHLGNFPQAFTHLALIDAALRLIAAEANTG